MSPDKSIPFTDTPSNILLLLLLRIANIVLKTIKKSATIIEMQIRGI